MTAAELRARLAELGWTQRHLAKVLGITPRSINRWATGSVDVPVYCAAYLAAPHPRVSRKAKRIAATGRGSIHG